MEKLSNLNNNSEEIIRNSINFENSLSKMGLTYGDVYYRLNEFGVTEFNDILTKSGKLIEGPGGKYMGRKDFQSSDNGLRTAEETRLDCNMGNIQELLFCFDNIDFMPNPKATNKNIDSDENITTKQLDLIHRPTGRQVEFKVCYSKLYGSNAYYNHRNGKFRKFLEDGNLMIIYFINLNKVAVISKKNLDKSVRIKEENIWKYNKYWDKITVWEGLMLKYTMMHGGNSEISDKISKIVKYEKSK